MGYTPDQGEGSSYRVPSEYRSREAGGPSRDPGAFSGSFYMPPYTPSMGGYPALFPDRTLPHEYAMASQDTQSQGQSQENTSGWHFR